MHACGLPVISIVVSLRPLPRKTTPLPLMFSADLQWKIPGPSTTAPLNPPAGSSFATVSSADWIKAESSAPDGLTVAFTGTLGNATPPPI